MTAVAAQLRIIEAAHESRRRDGLPDGVDTLTFFEEPLTSLGLRLLAERRPDLKGLYLMRTQVTDEGFEAINGFRDLEVLNMDETALTEASIPKLDSTLPIRHLKLTQAQVSPPSFAHLARMEALRTLECQCCMHVNEPLGAPIDDALSALGGKTDLQHLDVSGHIILGSGLRALHRMANLRHLGLNHTLAPADALAELACLPNLETLLLKATALNDDALAALAPLQQLRHLNVSSTAITDRAVPTILGFRHLEGLSFENVRVSREAAATLFELPNLTSLELCIDGVDGDDWYAYIQNRPGFHLEA